MEIGVGVKIVRAGHGLALLIDQEGLLAVKDHGDAVVEDGGKLIARRDHHAVVRRVQIAVQPARGVSVDDGAVRDRPELHVFKGDHSLAGLVDGAVQPVPADHRQPGLAEDAVVRRQTVDVIILILRRDGPFAVLVHEAPGIAERIVAEGGIEDALHHGRQALVEAAHLVDHGLCLREHVGEEDLRQRSVRVHPARAHDAPDGDQPLVRGADHAVSERFAPVHALAVRAVGVGGLDGDRHAGVGGEIGVAVVEQDEVPLNVAVLQIEPGLRIFVRIPVQGKRGIAAGPVHEARVVIVRGDRDLPVLAVHHDDVIVLRHRHVRADDGLALAEAEGHVILERDHDLAGLVDEAPLAVLLDRGEALIEGAGIVILGCDGHFIVQHAAFGILSGKGRDAQAQAKYQRQGQGKNSLFHFALLLSLKFSSFLLRRRPSADPA